MSITISTAEILDALASASRSDNPENARTTAEICAETGLGIKTVRAALHAYDRQGRLATHRVLRPRLGGGHAWAPAFTILPAKRKR
jgi:DNA-binding transcriptional regulator PaaX